VAPSELRFSAFRVLFTALERGARDRYDGALPSLSNPIFKTLPANSTLTAKISIEMRAPMVFQVTDPTVYLPTK
jgi:hypothetical protein